MKDWAVNGIEFCSSCIAVWTGCIILLLFCSIIFLLFAPMDDTSPFISNKHFLLSEDKCSIQKSSSEVSMKPPF